MKVILTKDVPGLGSLGEIKEVSAGYARNFLLPKRLVMVATPESLSRRKKEAIEREDKLSKQHEKWLSLKNSLETKTFNLKAKSSKEKLFAAISREQIIEVVNQKAGTELDPKQLTIETPIKLLGLSEVNLKLGDKISAKLKINVESNNA